MSLVPIQRILVLDDDEIMRGVLEMLLSTEDFEVTLAQGGEDALRLLHSGIAFEVILSDVHMPGLQGKALADTLRSAAGQKTVVLGMSGSEPSQEVRAAFDGFLFKPFGVQLLRDTVVAATEHRLAISQDVIALQSPPLIHGEALDDKIFSSLMRMISSAQLGQLFAMALKDIEKRHERILFAARQDDLVTAQREAHAIKGSCGMIGAAELQSLAAAIEGGNTINMTAIEEIPAACLRLQRVLESKL